MITEKKEWVAAVDIGGTNIRTALVSINKNCINKGCESLLNDCIKEYSEEKINTATYDERSLIKQITDMLQSSIDKSGEKPTAIGISIGAIIDKMNRCFEVPSTLEDKCIFLTEPIKNKFGLPTTILSDCKAGVFGEYEYGGYNSDNIKT